MNAQDDRIGGLDGPLLVMIEMPINTLQPLGALVLGSQGIIECEINGAERIAATPLEILPRPESRSGFPA